MTIEIRQLVIRATVDPDPSRSTTPRAQRATPRRESPDLADDPADREAIVATCVQRVLRDLRRAKER